MPELNTIGHHLLVALTSAAHSEDIESRTRARAEKVNVVGAGEVLTAAYEQLRNAAENTEEHLLVQNAIRRFYKQLFVTRDEGLIRTSGNELAIELTYAGYVPNNTLTKDQIEDISKIATAHYTAYEKLQKRRGINADTSTAWILDTLSASIARQIGSVQKDDAFISVAYQYFEQVAHQEYTDKSLDADEYGAALFVAVHKALLKSNTAVIRTALLQRYEITVQEEERYIAYNQRIDTLLRSPATDKFYHMVDRQGAPLRIVRRMIEDKADFLQLLPRHDAFLDAFEQQVTREYSSIMGRVNRAIVRSVIFLIITKFLIGIAVEVPYDIWANGHIVWQPLIINLCFPPLYMVALRLTLNLPGYANTQALVDRADTMFYGEGTMLVKKRSGSFGRYSSAFSALYVIFSLLVFGGVIWLLLLLGFELVHIAIFFIFVSAASFLGFRLSRLIRELEIVRSRSNGFTFIRDAIYLPFVVVGRWMSEKYAQVNVVALVLDMMIELPLKTVLRLVRQWGAFIDERKDRI